ncbi:hypothetical protein [Mesorhizobium xinjiangense]|uniref:hypothetical protein n=1 Tax=Mesorhizobium xinjiangense TaxID=2678685 RepID=UPI0012ED9F04|nr:hypothetical protein [Mesorhizobium xinjiangense]
MSGLTGKQAALSAVVSRYPQFELTIRRLFGADESFRDICEELADAERALANVDELPIALREARRMEWQELVDRLAEEARTAILDGERVTKSRIVPPPSR